MKPKTTALLIVAVLVAPSLALLPFLAGPATAVPTSVVPVAFAAVPGRGDVKLNLFDKGPGAASDGAGAEVPSCRADGAANADRCYMSPALMPRSVRNSGNAQEKTQAYTFVSGGGPADASETAQWILDTRLDTDPGNAAADVNEPLQHAFRIPAGSPSMRLDLWFQAPALPCSATAQYTITVLVLSGAPATTPGELARDGIWACTPGLGAAGNRTALLATGTTRVQVPIASETDIVVPEGHLVYVRAFVRASGTVPGTQWSAVYGVDDRDSGLQLFRTNAVEAAVWLTAKDSTVPVDTFDPTAVSANARTVEVRAALLSPLGPVLVPDSTQSDAQLRYRIVDPSDAVQDLLVRSAEDTTRTTSAPMVSVTGATEGAGSLRVYQSGTVTEGDSGPQTPWIYPRGITPGAYRAIVTVNVLGTSFEVVKSFAMQSFGFTFGLFPGETSSHRFNPGSSTTFLLNLTNAAALADVYAVRTQVQESSPAGAAWSVLLEGAQTTGQSGLALPAGERAIIKVRVTPPSTATAGDFVRIAVTATSAGSGSVKNLSAPLEAQVSTTVDHGAAVFYTGARPAPVRVGQSNNITAFVWNRGTAPDSFTILVPGTGLDTDLFTVAPATPTVSGVPAGDIAPAIVTVRVDPDAAEGTTAGVLVQARPASQLSGPTPPGVTVPILTQVRRDFTAQVVTASGELGQSSTRWLRYTCDPEANTECFIEDGASTSWAFHEFRVTNTGDVSEDFVATVRDVSVQFLEPATPADRTYFDTEGDLRPALLESVDFEAPGSGTAADTITFDLDLGETKFFWLRVHSRNEGGEHGPDANRGSIDPAAALIAAVRVAIPDTTLVRIIGTTTESNFNCRFNCPTFIRFDAMGRGEGGLAVANETELFLTPGALSAPRFVVTHANQYPSQLRINLAPSNRIGAMLDAGWTFRLIDVALGTGRPVLNASDTYTTPPGGEPPTVGHSTEFELRVTPPATGVQQGEAFSFVVQAQDLTQEGVLRSLGYQAFIGSRHAFELPEPAVDELTAHRGDIVAFPLQVGNTGASADTFDIEVTAPGAGWDVRARPATVSVPPGRTMTIAIEARVPATAAFGDLAIVEATVESRADGRTLSQVFRIRPEETQGGVQVSARAGEGTGDAALSDQMTLTISPSRSARYPIVVRNAGNAPESVCLFTVVSSPGFTLPSGTGSCDDFDAFRRIPPGETREHSFVITAPATILQSSRFPFMLRAQNTTTPADYDQVLLYAVVEGVVGAEIEPDLNRVVVPSGDASCLNATLRNTGTQNGTFVLRSAFQSAGWTARVRPIDNGRLGTALPEPATLTLPQGGLRRLCFDVAPPADAAPGTATPFDIIVSAENAPDVLARTTATAVVQAYGVAMTLQGSREGSGGPGDAVRYLVDVTNTGNGPDVFRFAFAGEGGGAPALPTRSSLGGDSLARPLAAGETIRNVEIIVTVPPPTPEFRTADVPVTTTVRAISVGSESVQGATAATATETVRTRVVPFVAWDVDGDGQPEVAIDADANAGNGYEVFSDVDDALAEAGVTFDAIQTTSLYSIPMADGRTKHLVSPQGGRAVYFDPDRPFSANITWVLDVTGDTSPEYSIDADFDGLVDGVFEPATQKVHRAFSADFKGFGRLEQIVDTDDDGTFDTFVDPESSTVTPVTRRGGIYHIDSDGDGRTDTYYDPQSGEVTEAAPSGFGDFMRTYWYFVLLFLIVIGVFIALVVRRL